MLRTAASLLSSHTVILAATTPVRIGCSRRNLRNLSLICRTGSCFIYRSPSRRWGLCTRELIASQSLTTRRCSSSWWSQCGISARQIAQRSGRGIFRHSSRAEASPSRTAAVATRRTAASTARAAKGWLRSGGAASGDQDFPTLLGLLVVNGLRWACCAGLCPLRGGQRGSRQKRSRRLTTDRRPRGHLFKRPHHSTLTGSGDTVAAFRYWPAWPRPRDRRRGWRSGQAAVPRA
jgi:hypothetical protein